ncbi:hypothetical protein ROZALSC1DRAFT_21695 [Rozella allomycis CSF55]|uniref:Uncharacterized protein n=1 Tax=Rozella allomycis (strain CSF55) TaxID=988480 RepID=A0A4P9YME4_ROZAC|nr:hypothetical protein ROZALSC1DRAFT_21695 [Rozella allomycis CSF55]
MISTLVFLFVLLLAAHAFIISFVLSSTFSDLFSNKYLITVVKNVGKHLQILDEKFLLNEALITNRGVFSGLVALSVLSATANTLLSVLKYFSVIIDPIKRSRYSKITVVLNCMFAIIWMAMGIKDCIVSPILPPKYSSAFSYLSLVLVLENIILGTFLFTLKMYQQAKQFKNQRISNLITTINIANFIVQVFWIFGIVALVTLSGTFYLTPCLIIFHNSIAFVENFTDVYNRSVSNSKPIGVSSNNPLASNTAKSSTINKV